MVLSGREVADGLCRSKIFLAVYDFSVIDSDISEEYFVPKLLLCPQSLGLTAGF